MDKDHIRQIVEHFRGTGVPVTQDLLTEYCNLNKFPVFPLSEYEVWEYQSKYDERLAKVFPLILAELCNVSFVPALATESVKKAADAANETVEINIAKILEENEALYRVGMVSEVDQMISNTAQMIAGTLDLAKNRANSTAAAAIARIAREKLGGKLTLKALVTYLRGEADKELS